MGSYLRKLVSSFASREGSTHGRRRPARHHLLLEALEDRLAPAIQPVSVIDPSFIAAVGNKSSDIPTMSANGRYVAFESTATNLVPGVAPQGTLNTQIFVRDTLLGTTTLVSSDSNGIQANAGAFNPCLALDASGHVYVAFESPATNLTSGGNGKRQVFVKDLTTQATTLVSCTTNGIQGNNDSVLPSLAFGVNGDTFVAFQGFATNLTSAGGNGKYQIFVKDITANRISLVTTDGSGHLSNADADQPKLAAAANGDILLAFQSEASNLPAAPANGFVNVFETELSQDLGAGTTTLVSTDSAGNPANFHSFVEAIAVDHDNHIRVAFSTTASNLISGDSGTSVDVFVKNLFTHATQCASTDSSGNAVADESTSSIEAKLAVDGNGHFLVAFASNNKNLVPGDTEINDQVFLKDLDTQAITLLSANSNGDINHYIDLDCGGVGIDGNGNVVVAFAAGSNNLTGAPKGIDQVLLKTKDPHTNANTGPITVASAPNSVQPAGGSLSTQFAASSDGRYVAFQSSANKLVPGDTNAAGDVFVRDTVTDATTRASTDSSGHQANNVSADPAFAFAANGDRLIAFDSKATNLISGITGQQVYVRDLHGDGTGNVILVTSDSNGIQGNGASSNPAIAVAPNGHRLVAFVSSATNLGNPAASGQQIFVKDLDANVVTLVSKSSAGRPGNASSSSPALALDSNGNVFVSFQSNATNLLSGDTNGFTDVFVEELDQNLSPVAITRISTDSTGKQGNGNSTRPSLVIDGSGGVFVGFQSDARNLVSTDTNAHTDIFVAKLNPDLSTALVTCVSTDSTGKQGNGNSSAPALAIDANHNVFASFQSDASNLVSGDTNRATDVFIKNLSTGAIARVSTDRLGREGNGSSTTPALAVDSHGQICVAFSSAASNLVQGDANGSTDVFLWHGEPLTIQGSTALTSIKETETALPFSQVTIADPGLPNQAVTVTVTLDDATKGAFTPTSLNITGFKDMGGGVYQLTGTAAQATNLIRQLVFAPNTAGIPQNVLVDTTFTIAVSDGFSTPATDSSTVVQTRYFLFIVNTTNDTTAANLVSGLDGAGNISLRSAIQAANNDGKGRIVLDGSLYTLTQEGAGEDNAASGDLDIHSNVTIIANGATVDGGGLDRVFQVFAGFNVTFDNLIVRNGTAEQGAGIFNAGTLSLVDGCFVGFGTSVRSTATGTNAQGGGIYNAATGVLTMTGGQIYGAAVGTPGVDGAIGKDGDKGDPESNGKAGSKGFDGQNGGTAQGGCIYNAGGTVTLTNVGLDGVVNGGTGGNGGRGGFGGNGGDNGASVPGPGNSASGGNGADGGRGGKGGDAGGGVLFSTGGSITISSGTLSGTVQAGNAGSGGAGGGGGSGTNGKDGFTSQLSAADGGPGWHGGSGGNGGNGGAAGLAGDARGGVFAIDAGMLTVSAISSISGLIFGGNNGIGGIGGYGAPGGPGGAGGSGNDTGTLDQLFAGGAGGAGGHGGSGGNGAAAGTGGNAFGGVVDATAGAIVFTACDMTGTAYGGSGATVWVNGDVGGAAGPGGPGGQGGFSNITYQGGADTGPTFPGGPGGNGANGGAGGTAGSGGNGGSAFGGGLSLRGASLILDRTTLRASLAQAGDGGGASLAGPGANGGNGGAGGACVAQNATGNAIGKGGDAGDGGDTPRSSDGGNGGSAQGGGLFLGGGGSATLINATLGQNTATPGKHGAKVNDTMQTAGAAGVGGQGDPFGANGGHTGEVLGLPSTDGIDGTAQGGGIDAEANLSLSSSTLAENETVLGPGGNVFAAAGAIVTVKNTIIARGRAGGVGPDVNGVFVDQGHNLIGLGDSSTSFTDGINGDMVGTAGVPLDPMLSPLQNNGGPGFTYRPLADVPAIRLPAPNGTSVSPVINAGDNSGAPATDALGLPRIFGDVIDIGAVEFDDPLLAANGTLYIDGTMGDDGITVTQPGGNRIEVDFGGGHPNSTFALQDINFNVILKAIAIRGLDGNDTITVDSGVTLPATIDGGTGTNTLQGGSGDDTFINEGGTDTIDGGAGKNSLTGPGTTSRWVLTANDAGTLNSTTSFQHIGFLAGLASQDTLVGPDTENTWLVLAKDAGSLNTTTFFAGMESLVGGSGNDTFTFGDAVTLSGSIDGGGGSNTLDYSAFSAAHAVAVNLAAGAATAIAGGIKNIANVTGGAGNDTLIGDSHDNTFTGGPGLNTISGGGGNNTIVEQADVNMVLSGNASSATLTAYRLVAGKQQNVGRDTLKSIQSAILIGGSSNNTLDASGFNGTVVLIGGAGSDVLKSGPGRGILIGGSGADTFTAGSGGDVLIGGTTTLFDEARGVPNIAAIASALAPWADTKTNYQLRVANLLHVLGDTVADDSAANLLTGGAGLDWFIVGAHDTVKNRQTGAAGGGPEQVTTV